jgi:hypothetical protein
MMELSAKVKSCIVSLEMKTKIEITSVQDTEIFVVKISMKIGVNVNMKVKLIVLPSKPSSMISWVNMIPMLMETST